MFLAALCSVAAVAGANEEVPACFDDAVQDSFTYTTETATLSVAIDRLCFELGWEQPLGDFTIKMRIGDGDWDDSRQTRAFCPQSESICHGSMTYAHGPIEVPRRYLVEYIVDSEVEPGIAASWWYHDCWSTVVAAWCDSFTPPLPQDG